MTIERLRADVRAQRLRAVRAAMAEAEVDALVLRPSPDFRFLGGGDCADSSAADSSGAGFPGADLSGADLSGAAFLVVTRDVIAATGDPAALVPEGARRVGVDPEMRVRELFGLTIEAELVPASAVLAPLRLRKEPEELAAIERAALCAGGVLRQAGELAWFGATEREMAAALRVLALESGCEEVLSLRVAAGEHTSRAAHAPGERVINPGDALLVSLCGRWGGYCAEVARVFAVAEPPEDFEAMYSVVLAAHRAALSAARPAAPASEVARAVGDVIDGSGYGRFAAGHAGRGVGLGADEGPRLSEDTPLEPGMTFCLEPAIYVPDLFGARVADVVACTEAGPLVLSGGPPPLHVLDR